MKRTALCIMMGCLLAQGAAACPMCYGGTDAPATDGANNAILFMLGVVGLMLGGFGCFFVTLFLRARRPLPPHEALIELIQNEEGSHA